jgi:hypothetical protein
MVTLLSTRVRTSNPKGLGYFETGNTDSSLFAIAKLCDAMNQTSCKPFMSIFT